MKSLFCALLLSLAVGAGTAFAQNPPPSTGQSASPSAADRKAISKSCSDQANAKGLHGKARKKFRLACKHAGGKVE